MSLRKRHKVLVLFDTAGTPPEDQDFSEEFGTEEWKTEAQVISTLKKTGHDVRTLGIYGELGLLYKTLKDDRPDIVFNLTEHFGGKGHLDKAVVGIFEMMGIPYTGCGYAGLMLCRHKELSKKLLSFHKIKNPPFAYIKRGEKFRGNGLRLPCIVKKASDDASVGISQASLVETKDELKERVGFVHEKLMDDALVERFIPGRELYVSVLGNRRHKVFPIRELVFGRLPDKEQAFATYKTKWDMRYRERWGIENVFPGDLPKETGEKIAGVCRRICRILKIDGYARIDLRLTPHGELVFIEANPNPFLASDEDFGESAKAAGIPFGELLGKIMNLGFRRERVA
jgi:D-alanine-D-alanine ligase